MSGKLQRPALWDRKIYGPLLELPWSQRLPIMRAVKAGESVDCPGDPARIIRFVDWQIRRFIWITCVATAVVVLVTIDLIVDGPSFPELYGIAAITVIGASAVRIRRSRRTRASLAASTGP
jgi:hypothetical protein